MSAQRMTLELRKRSASIGRNRLGRQSWLAAGLFALVLPLSGGGSGPRWVKVVAKDETFTQGPAGKLYNEGRYLVNQKHQPKAQSKKVSAVCCPHPHSA